jgi:translation elongation factor EF-1beta
MPLDNPEIKMIPRKEVITFGENLTVVTGDLENNSEKKHTKYIETEEQSYFKSDEIGLKKTENVKEDLTYVDKNKETAKGQDITAAPARQVSKEEKKSKQPEKSTQQKTLPKEPSNEKLLPEKPIAVGLKEIKEEAPVETPVEETESVTESAPESVESVEDASSNETDAEKAAPKKSNKKK